MGNAPQIKAELERNRKRKWYLDTTTGEIKAELELVTDTAVAVRPQPVPVKAARHTWD